MLRDLHWEAMGPLAIKIQNTAIYESVQPSTLTPPPEHMISGHYLNRFGYRVLRPHGAGSWLLFFSVQGTGRFQQPGLVTEARPGDLHLLGPDAYSDYGTAPPNDFKKTPKPSARQGRKNSYIQYLHLSEGRTRPNRKIHGWRFHWIHFQPEPTWFELLKLPVLGPGLGHLKIKDKRLRERIQKAFERIHLDLMTESQAGERLAKLALEEILVLISKEKEMAILDPRIQQAMQALRETPGRKHTVATLARTAHLSASRFAHLFKQQTGHSITQTLLSLRIRQAARLLATSDDRISNIAETMGFYSPYVFSKQFKDRIGMSPRAYRNSVRQGEARESVPRGWRLDQKRFKELAKAGVRSESARP